MLEKLQKKNSNLFDHHLHEIFGLHSGRLGLITGPDQTSPTIVQTRSRQSLHILFIYLFKIEDGGLVWDGTVSSSQQRAWCIVQDSIVRSRSTTWSQRLKNNKNGGGIYDICAP